MDEAQLALWERVKTEGELTNKVFTSLHILEKRWMLEGRELAVLFEFTIDEPCDIYYVDEQIDIRDLYLLYKDDL